MLAHLDGSDGAATLEVSVSAAAASEDGRKPPDGDDRLLISLHRAHLPKLDAAGAVGDDATARTARLREGNDRLLAFLYVDPEP